MAMADAFVCKVLVELKAVFENGSNIGPRMLIRVILELIFSLLRHRCPPLQPLPTGAFDPACITKD
jgi:hypothetical protein